jgi:glutamate-1-semialdehyde 2,1-aminomutase
MVAGEAGPVHDFDEAKSTDESAYARFFHAMLDAGVAMAPGAYEAIFVGLAHDDRIIDQIGDAAHQAATTVLSGQSAQR